MGRPTHPANMSPEMRAAQLRAGLVCSACGGTGEHVVSHGMRHVPHIGKCPFCKGTGRKQT